MIVMSARFTKSDWMPDSCLRGEGGGKERAHHMLLATPILFTHCMRSMFCRSGSSIGYPPIGPASATPLIIDMPPPSVAM